MQRLLAFLNIPTNIIDLGGEILFEDRDLAALQVRLQEKWTALLLFKFPERRARHLNWFTYFR
jgi:hypothetical protein